MLVLVEPSIKIHAEYTLQKEIVVSDLETNSKGVKSGERTEVRGEWTEDVRVGEYKSVIKTVYDGTEVKPIILDTKSLEFKTSVNDRLINYTINFSYAYNKINDIR